jgi:hypothetical protein
LPLESWRLSGVNDHAGIAASAARECGRKALSLAKILLT